MKYTPQQRFDILNRFIGWGNPKGGIWFIGLEEHGEWTMDSDTAIKENYDFENGFDSKSKDEILQFPDYSLYKNIKRILINDKVEIEKVPNIFIANLFPLALQTIKLEKHNEKRWQAWQRVYPGYKELFGLSDEETHFSMHHKMVSKSRFPIIKAMYDQYKPKIVICHGMEEHDFFKKCFELKGEPWENYPNEKGGNQFGYYHFQDNAILIVGHLSYNSNLNRFLKYHLDLINAAFND